MGLECATCLALLRLLQVRYEVGMCSPVADIYKSVHIATCDDLLDGLVCAS